MDCPASEEELCLRQQQAAATDPMHVADMQDFRMAHRHRINTYNQHPPAPTFRPDTWVPLYRSLVPSFYST